VKGSLFFRGAFVAGKAQLVASNIGGNLDTRETTFALLDLSGSSIAGILSLGTPDNSSTYFPDISKEESGLYLRNTRVGSLMDSKYAWPTARHLHLDGFSFARFGGLEGDAGAIMRSRGMQWWDQWARRDPKYSPTPYEQLVGVLLGAGDRSSVDEVRYLGRVREREQEKDEKKWRSWIYSGFLQYVAGFGIGSYAFRVIYWVIATSMLGAIYLWMRVPAAREHGPTWCFGASLSRLLPVIEINKEFSDFFNDPKRERLTGYQSFVFSVIAMAGWLLGAILVAAVSGLTPKI
jgi:hypothetical protein